MGTIDVLKWLVTTSLLALKSVLPSTVPYLFYLVNTLVFGS